MAFKMSDEARKITIYNLRADTLEFIGKGDAFIPPHTGLPANSTTIAPPAIDEGYVAIFDMDTSQWSIIEDHRGEVVYSTITGEEIYIREPGSYPNNSTPIKPDEDFVRWDGTSWVEDVEASRESLIADAQNQKSALLQQAGEKIAPLQDAVELEMASDEELTSLILWKKYRVLLNRINPQDVPDIIWPEIPS